MRPEIQQVLSLSSVRGFRGAGLRDVKKAKSSRLSETSDGYALELLGLQHSKSEGSLNSAGSCKEEEVNRQTHTKDKA